MSHPPQFLLVTHCEKSFGYQPISASNKSLVTRLCHDTDGGAASVRSRLRLQVPFLALVKHSSKEIKVFRTLACVWERSKYRTATCRPDLKWSAAAGRPTSPHFNRDSSPVRFSSVLNGHFGPSLRFENAANVESSLTFYYEKNFYEVTNRDLFETPIDPEMREIAISR